MEPGRWFVKVKPTENVKSIHEINVADCVTLKPMNMVFTKEKTSKTALILYPVECTRRFITPLGMFLGFKITCHRELFCKVLDF